ncbi:probable carboxylesterase 2 [Juglans regia]|uniref:Probable carboxylesterase 2 n=2 Tax=Juglans regia TaxID=51240 RepID=A0A6P9EGL2_JUGRE|nr:probable carboxylesterase 2 [Juglans regia]
MDPSHLNPDPDQIALEVFPYLRVFKDGTVERIAGTQVVPAGVDPQTGVESKDIVIEPETSVSARLYRPNLPGKNHKKVPLVVYFHGGAFCISSVADPLYHHSLNMLVADANAIAISVEYSRVPEHPLPEAYEDCWAALRWVAAQAVGDHHEQEPWLKDYVDFGRVFLVGDSAGANISHHLALRAMNSKLPGNLKILGIGLIHPYFWGESPIGLEVTESVRKAMVDNWWRYVCPSEDKSCDDPLINPFTDESPSLAGLACDKILVIVAEKDILRDRGKLYYENLVKSGWRGSKDIMETQGEDHVFHIFDPNSEKAKNLIKRLASFINE